MKSKLIGLLSLLPILTVAQTSKQSKWKQSLKNDLVFKISIPEGNFMYINKGDHYGHAFGFLLLAAGFEYYFTDKYNINMDVGALTDFKVPFPVPVCYFGLYDRSFAYYGDIQIGTNFKRFHVDAGFQYYFTSYQEKENLETKFSKEQGNLGLAFSTYFKVSRSFNVGINYYPSIVVFDDKVAKSHYGHLLFFELIYLIR